MQTVALTWLVLRLHGTGLVLGSTAALQYLPLLLLGPLAGVLVDRLDKRRLLFLTQSTAAFLALTLGLLTITDRIELWMVLVFALALGLVNAFDVPARQTFAYELVGPDLLPNAITLNSVVMNIGRVAGPAVAGLVIAFVGLAPCFLLNAMSYATLLVALLLMNPQRLFRSETAERHPRQLREGLRYVWTNPGLRTPLLVMAVVGTFTYEFQVMLPLLARDTFGSDASGFSLLMAVMGAGSIIGGLIGASRLQPSARRLGIAGFVLGALVILASVMPTLLSTTAVLFFVGAASITFLTLSNATLQLTASPEMRGRVIALFAVAFLGSIPIGGPIMGAIAGGLGPRLALALAGGAAVAATSVAWRRLNAVAAPAPDHSDESAIRDASMAIETAADTGAEDLRDAA
jgi:MFS family permease